MQVLAVNAPSVLRFASGRRPGRAEKLGSFRKNNVAARSQRFGLAGFRRRTPGPPPFSSMNTPRRIPSRAPQVAEFIATNSFNACLFANGPRFRRLQHQ